MKYYLLDENKNLIEGFDKEGFLALLEQAIEQGTLENIDEDSAVASKIRSVLNGTTHHIEFITQAQYNQLVADEELVANTWYFITDDTSVEEGLEDHENRITSLEALIPNLRKEIRNIDCPLDFSIWNDLYSGVFTSVSSEIIPLSLKNGSISISSRNYNLYNEIKILPIDSMASIAQARVDYVSGDEGYLHYVLDEIDASSNVITFSAILDQGDMFSPSSTTTRPTEDHETTFKLVVIDIYGNYFEKQFTINYRIAQPY